MKINFLCSTSFHEMTKEFQFLDTSGPPKSESDTQDHARSAFLMKTNGSKRPKFHKNRIKRGQFKKKLSFYFLHIYKKYDLGINNYFLSVKKADLMWFCRWYPFSGSPLGSKNSIHLSFHGMEWCGETSILLLEKYEVHENWQLVTQGIIWSLLVTFFTKK